MLLRPPHRPRNWTAQPDAALARFCCAVYRRRRPGRAGSRSAGLVGSVIDQVLRVENLSGSNGGYISLRRGAKLDLAVAGAADRRVEFVRVALRAVADATLSRGSIENTLG